MKKASALIAYLCFSLASIAQDVQETTIPKTIFPRKNEIGLMAQMSLNNSEDMGSMDIRGLQYKRWVKPNKAYRIIAAYGDYQEYQRPQVQTKIGDTITEVSRYAKISNAVLGVGIEMQRRFYKHVYLFAAIELKGSYGSGSYSYLTSQRVENNPNNDRFATSKTGDATATMYSVSATPSIGAKIQFNRWGFGTEMSAIQLSFVGINYAKAAPSKQGGDVGEFSTDMFHQRFFAYFRF